MSRIAWRRAAPLLVCAAALGATAPAAPAASGWSDAQQHGVAAVDDNRGFTTTELDMGARGDAVIAGRFWDPATSRFRLQVLDRVAHGAFAGPRPLAGAAVGDYAPQVAVAADGHAALGFLPQAGEPRVLRRTPAGDWVALPAPPAGMSVDDLVVQPGGAVTIVSSDFECAPSCVDRIRVSTAAPGGGWSAPATVASSTSPYSLNTISLGADAAGGLVLSYTETWSHGQSMGSSHRAFLTTRSAAGAWAQPTALTAFNRGERWTTLLDVNDAGDAAVLVMGIDGILMTRRPAGGSFGALTPLSPAGPSPVRPTVVVGDDGHVAASYRHYPPTDTYGRVSVFSGGMTGPLAEETIERTLADGTLMPAMAPLDSDGLLLLAGSPGHHNAFGTFLFSAVRPDGASSFTKIPAPQAGQSFYVQHWLVGDRQGNAVAFWQRHVQGEGGAETITSYTATYGPVPDPPPPDDTGTTGGTGGSGGTTGGGSGGSADSGGGATPAAPVAPVAPVTPVTPVTPVRTVERLRLAIPGGLVADRRGLVRMRLRFDAPVTGVLRLTDAAGRSLGRRSFTARAGVPVRVRVVVPRWALRKLRGGRIAVRATITVTTASGRTLRVTTPTTLRRGR